MLANAAGFLHDPIISEPSAIGIKPPATAEAAPPLEPPALFEMSYAFPVIPKTRLKVCDPNPNSGVFVLPMMIAPLLIRRSTIMLFFLGILFLYLGMP